MVIYKIVNKITGMAYIGQTTKSIHTRLIQHKNCKNCRYLHTAIKKYGINNFEIYEISTPLYLEHADTVETALIKQEGTLAPKGYNLTLGGRSNIIVSDATRALQSKSGKGKRMGILNHQFGKPHTELTKSKIRAKNTGITRWSTPIVDDLENKIKSVKDAAKYYKVGRTAVSNVLSGHSKQLRCGRRFFYQNKENI